MGIRQRNPIIGMLVNYTQFTKASGKGEERFLSPDGKVAFCELPDGMWEYRIYENDVKPVDVDDESVPYRGVGTFDSIEDAYSMYQVLG